jgi:hypothetical protein
MDDYNYEYEINKMIKWLTELEVSKRDIEEMVKVLEKPCSTDLEFDRYVLHKLTFKQTPLSSIEYAIWDTKKKGDIALCRDYKTVERLTKLLNEDEERNARFCD